MIRRRNMWMQVLLMVVTLGIYSIYWFYVTFKEKVDYKGLGSNPAVWTILMLIPYVGIFSFWKHSEAVSAFTDRRYNKFLIFILWIVFSPAVWFITQTELNKRATAPA